MEKRNMRRISRPARIGGAMAGVAALVASSVLFAQVEPKASTWRTWVVPSASELRLPPPPDSDATALELQTLKDRIAGADPAMMASVAYWDAGSPEYRWLQIAAKQMLDRNVPAPLFTRAMALLSVAMYDATIAAWDSKYSYNRPHPNLIDSAVSPSVPLADVPSYPSEHAVAAGAASVVLAYLFPAQADDYSNLAEQAANSRLYAGAALPSDIAAGLDLGRKAGGMIVAYARADGSDSAFTGSLPLSPETWGSASPVTPLAGTWRPWVLAAGSDFRLPPPPSNTSGEFMAQVAAVKAFPRTNATNHSAWFWQPSFITPWLDNLHREIFESRLDGNAPRAARAYALEAIAQHDATIACWDTKYAYLELRPSLADTTIAPLFGNPQHPGFPSGHACASQAAAAVQSYLFPSDAAAIAAMANDAGLSTFDAAIHTMFDVQQGFVLGGDVGSAVVEQAKGDGAQSGQRSAK